MPIQTVDTIITTIKRVCSPKKKFRRICDVRSRKKPAGQPTASPQSAHGQTTAIPLGNLGTVHRPMNTTRPQVIISGPRWPDTATRPKPARTTISSKKNCLINSSAKKDDSRATSGPNLFKQTSTKYIKSLATKINCLGKYKKSAPKVTSYLTHANPANLGQPGQNTTRDTRDTNNSR